MIEKVISEQKKDKNSSDPDEFCCPITREIMKYPVLCSLDGYTYEKNAITKWLNEHKSSPMTRTKMKANQTVESVLSENRSLKDAIGRYHHRSAENSTKESEKSSLQSVSISQAK